ncbi:MAG: hypothetical protein ACK5N0_00790 [Synechococcaceae cyanobacterium]
MAIIAAAACLACLLLIGLLHRHFTSVATSWSISPTSHVRKGPGNTYQQSYQLTNEMAPKVQTSPDKRIEIGVQIENIYDLSMKDRVFKVEGWYWLKWPELINTIIKENGIQQEKLIELTNQVDSDNLLVETEQPNPERLSDGKYWQIFHFSGTFYIDKLRLSAFPFVELTLPVGLELGPDLLSCYPGNKYGCIGLDTDQNTNNHILGQYADINGYTLLGAEIKEYLHQYATNFGYTKPGANSAVTVHILYHSNCSAAFWAYIFPLLILIGIAIMSPSLPGSLGDVRLAIPTTILLTLIFLQIGYKTDLPAMDYVSYLDWLYIYAYFVSGVLFLLFCWSTNLHAKACNDNNEGKAIRSIRRVDMMVQSCAFVGLLLALGSGLLFQP